MRIHESLTIKIPFKCQNFKRSQYITSFQYKESFGKENYFRIFSLLSFVIEDFSEKFNSSCKRIRIPQ